jgi:type VII secretion protein EccB
MASRSDQLHSQQFTVARVVAALAMRDADASAAPARRAGGSLLAGLLLAVLGLAAGGVYAVLRPGGDASWRDGTSVIVESETGARFVYRDGVLYPVLNYSSARLVLGANALTVRASRAALAGVPRGHPIGIPGAPDALPTAADLLRGTWNLCSRPATAASAVESVLLLGAAPTVEDLGGRGLIGVDPSGGLHLLWNHRRFAITAPVVVLAAFAWSRQAAVPIAPALLNAIPAGPDLGPVTLPAGTGPSVVDGYRTGQVFLVENQSGGRQYGVALAGGLAEVTPVQADLLLAAGSNGLSGKPLPMGEAQYASAPRAGSLVPTGDAAPPASAPQLASPTTGAAVCAAFTDGATVPSLAVAPVPPRQTAELQAGTGGATVDWIGVPPGHGAVIEALAGPGAPSGALALVTDTGQRFPVPTSDAMGMLGFGGVRPLRLPSAVVALVPPGPALDPAAAALPAGP